MPQRKIALLKSFILTLTLVVVSQMQVFSQADCIGELNVSLGTDGLALIQVESIVIGDFEDYSDLSFEVLLFDCSKVGENVYEITGDYQGTPFECSGKIIVEDLIIPTAICATNREPVFSAGVDTIWLIPEYIDDGSYDNCEVTSMQVTPAFLTRDDIGNQVEITLTVIDHSGNENICFSNLIAREGQAQSLLCINLFNVKVGTEPVLITKEEVLSIPVSEMGPNLILTLTDSNGNTVDDNLVTEEYIGTQLTFTVTDLFTNNSCFGTVDVTCASLLICDTLSTCAMSGDCQSGHTEDDNVEWPCDLDLVIQYNGSIDAVPELLTAEYLTQGLGRDTLGTIVDLVGFPDECILINYSDQEVPVDESNIKIVRTWTLLDFTNSMDYDYVQLIDVAITPHLQGEINWPPDIEVNDIRIHPEELIRISYVSPYVVYPTFSENYTVSYVDQLINDTGSRLEVTRAWTVLQNGVEVASQNQNIAVNYSNLSTQVSVQGSNYNGVPDVLVNQAAMTNGIGIALSGQVPAVYSLESNLNQRLNIRDLNSLQLYLLNLRIYNEYQILNSDLNGSQTITSLDWMLLQDLIFEKEDFIQDNTFEDIALNPIFPVYAEHKLLAQRGDVDQENICPAYPPQTSEIILNIDDKEVLPSSSDCVFFYSAGYSDINSFQCRLTYDPNVIEVTDVKEYSSQSGFFAFSTPLPGEVTIISGHDTPHSAHPCIPIMQICYDVVGEVGQNTELQFVVDSPNNFNEVTILDENGGSVPLSLQLFGGEITIVETPQFRSKAYSLRAEDKLLNAGQPYIADFYLEDFEQSTDGIQVKLSLGDAIDISSLDVQTVQDADLVFYVNDQRILTVLLKSQLFDSLLNIDGEDPLLSLSFDAAANGLLSTSLLSIAEYSTFISDASRSIYLLDILVDNAFTTSTYDLQSDVLLISPNPVEDELILNLKDKEGDCQSCQVSITHVNGFKVLRQTGLTAISLNHLSEGIYFIQVQDENRIYTSKFSKLK